MNKRLYAWLCGLVALPVMIKAGPGDTTIEIAGDQQSQVTSGGKQTKDLGTLEASDIHSASTRLNASSSDIGDEVASTRTASTIDNDDVMIGPLNMVDQPLYLVLDDLAKWTNRTLIRDESLQNKTINVVLREAKPKMDAVAEVISALAGYKVSVSLQGSDYISAVPLDRGKNSACRFVEKANLKKEKETREVCTTIFRLKNANVRDVARQFTSLLTPGASNVSIVEPSNCMLVTDSLSNLQKINALIDEIDHVGNEELQVLTVKPKNISAKALKTCFDELQKGPLKHLLAGNASFAAQENANLFIATVSKEIAPILSKYIAQLDTDVAPLTKFHVINIMHGSAKEITELIKGIKAGMQGADTRYGQVSDQENQVGFSKTLSIACDERTNSIVVYGTLADYQQVSSLVKNLDVVLGQIRLEVVIAEVTLSDTQKSGLDSFGFSHGRAISDDGKVGAIGGHETSLRASGGPVAINALTFKKLSIDAVIEAANTNQNIAILSSPVLLTTHAHEAVLKSMETMPYITELKTKNTGGAGDAEVTNNTIEKVDAGIELTLKPLIGKNGMIQLEITQKVDHFGENVEVGNTKNPVKVPSITRREAKSYVTVKSGEMVVLAGIKDKETRDKVRKTPFLGSLPILSYIFSSKARENSEKELVIFIRPVLVNVDNAEEVRKDTEQHSVKLDEKVQQRADAFVEKGSFALPGDEKPGEAKEWWEKPRNVQRKALISDTQKKMKADDQVAKQAKPVPAEAGKEPLQNRAVPNQSAVQQPQRQRNLRRMRREAPVVQKKTVEQANNTVQRHAAVKEQPKPRVQQPRPAGANRNAQRLQRAQRRMQRQQPQQVVRPKQAVIRPADRPAPIGGKVPGRRVIRVIRRVPTT